MLSETKEIQKLFDKDQLFFMRTFFGPIQGMNLRNLVWHGFLNENVFPDCYSTMLLVLICSLPEFNQILSKFNRRKLFDDVSWVKSLDFELKLKKKFKCDKEEADIIGNLINECILIEKDFEKDWLKSYQYFQKNMNYEALIIIFPLIENFLRR